MVRVFITTVPQTRMKSRLSVADKHISLMNNLLDKGTDMVAGAFHAHKQLIAYNRGIVSW